MKKYIILTIAILCATALFAKGVSQAGIAYFYDYKTKTKQPVANVRLVVAGAAPTTSGADGTFTLVFERFGLGDKIGFSQPPYYQNQKIKVFNKKEVDNWYIVKAPLRLIMCKYEEFELAKENYYQQGKKAAQQRYEKLIAQIKAENILAEEKTIRLQEAEGIYKRDLDHLGESSEEMARIDQSELDAAMQEILSMYEQGWIEEAMRKLKSMNLKRQCEKRIKAIQYINQDLNALISQMRTAIQLYLNNGDWSSARENLKVIADLYNNSVLKSYEEFLDALVDIQTYAEFCDQQGYSTEAELYYKKALTMIDHQHDKGPNDCYAKEIENIRNSIVATLGGAYFKKKRFEEGEAVLSEVVQRQRLLVKEDNAYENGLAVSLTNLGNIYAHFCDNNEDTDVYYEKSKQCYEEALSIFNRLHSREQTAKSFSDIAMICNNLGLLLLESKETDESEKYLTKALSIQEQLFKEDSVLYEPELASSLHNLGILYFSTGENEKSIDYYRKAISIRKRLYNINPEAYGSDLVNSLLGEAEILFMTNFSANPIGITKFSEAIRLMRQIAENNPDQRLELANVLNNVGHAYINFFHTDLSQQLFLEELELCRQMAKERPERFLAGFSDLLEYMSVRYFAFDKAEKSEVYEKYRLEELSLYRQLSKTSLIIYGPKLAERLNHMGEFFSDSQRQQAEKSLQMHLEALEVLKNLVQYNPSDQELLRHLAQTYHYLGNDYLAINHKKDADEAFLAEIDIYRYFSKEKLEDADYYLASTLESVAGEYDAYGQYMKSEQLFEEALGIHREIAKTRSDMLFLAGKFKYLGYIYYEHGKFDESKKMYFEALDRTKKSYDTYAEILMSIGELYLSNKEYDLSEKYYKAAVMSYRKFRQDYKPEIHDEDSEDYDWRLQPKQYMYESKLAEALTSLGDVYTAKGLYKENLQVRQEAVDLYKLTASETEEDSVGLATVICKLAVAYLYLEKKAECQQYIKEAEEIYQKRLNDNFSVLLYEQCKNARLALALFINVASRWKEELNDHIKTANNIRDSIDDVEKKNLE